ncbi:MAG: hypothetical protein IKS03_02630 [Ruminococcus sp.]|nr:hypothetical protein [Ruminococcus sp.]
MADEFNFEITTKYKPEFDSKVTKENLCEILADEIENKDETTNKRHDDPVQSARKLVFTGDSSCITKKLREQLHLDITAYEDKNDKSKMFDLLKVLYFIAIDQCREKKSKNGSQPSILNLMIKSSLEHTDTKNAMHEERFKDKIEQYRKAVDDAEYREKKINEIHSFWNNIHNIIDSTMLEEIQTKCGEFKIIENRLKWLNYDLMRDDINNLQRPNEGIIKTFYNMMLSSRVIAEIEDMKNVLYDYRNEEDVCQEITDLFISEDTSKPMKWVEFKEIINRKKIDFSNEQTKNVWSMILYKKNVDNKDLEKYSDDYNFAEKYAETIAEYWLMEKHNEKEITLGQWIIVFQELLCIHHDKLTYVNTGIGHTNTNMKLTAAIKSFEQVSKLPHMIVLERLGNRSLLRFGTRDLFESKLKIDRYIADIEKVIFSYKNIEDIETAHNYLYFMVMTATVTPITSVDICGRIQSKLSKWHQGVSLNCYTFYDMQITEASWISQTGLPMLALAYNPNLYTSFDFLMRILSMDRNWRCVKFYGYEKANEIISKMNAYYLSGNTNELINYVKEINSSGCPVFAYEVLADKITKEINEKTKNDKRIIQPVHIDIYYGEENQYDLYVYFTFFNNFITISQITFKGKKVQTGIEYYNLHLLRA